MAHVAARFRVPRRPSRSERDCCVMSFMSRIREFVPAPRSATSGPAAATEAIVPLSMAMSSPIDVRQDRATKMMVAFFGIFIAFLLIGLFVGEFAKQEACAVRIVDDRAHAREHPAYGHCRERRRFQSEMVEAGQVIMSVAVTQVSTGGTTTTDVERRTLEARLQTIRGRTTPHRANRKTGRHRKGAARPRYGAVIASLEAQEKAGEGCTCAGTGRCTALQEAR